MACDFNVNILSGTVINFYKTCKLKHGDEDFPMKLKIPVHVELTKQINSVLNWEYRNVIKNTIITLQKLLKTIKSYLPVFYFLKICFNLNLMTKREGLVDF